VTDPKMPSPAELVEILQARIKDPERRALVATLGTKLAVLTAQSVLVAGSETDVAKQVQRDLQHVRSQMASLTAIETFALRDAVTSWLNRFVEAAILTALS
jgi:hypothetical protein